MTQKTAEAEKKGEVRVEYNSKLYALRRERGVRRFRSCRSLHRILVGNVRET